MRFMWNYAIILLLYHISESIYLVTGGASDSKLGTNRYHTQNQHQEKSMDESLCLNKKDGYATPTVALAAPEMTSPLMNSQSYTSSAENSLQHDHQIHKSSYNLLSEAMSQAVTHEFSKFNTFYFNYLKNYYK